jgi:hypothetical protein
MSVVQDRTVSSCTTIFFNGLVFSKTDVKNTKKRTIFGYPNTVFYIFLKKYTS